MSKVKFIITAICSTSVKTQKQKFGGNKHWLEEITQGANAVTEEQMKSQCIVALQKFLFNW